MRAWPARSPVLAALAAEQVGAAMGATVTSSGRIETHNYGAKDYLVVLRASINGVEETLASSHFRVEGAPSAPALYTPAMGGDVETFTPALTVSNAADPNEDTLTYQYQVYADSSLTSLVSSVEMQPETAGITAWTVATPLTENRTYYWRARAYDGLLYGPWMATASFRVNTGNDLPTAPAVSSPTDATAVAVLTPQLTVTNASDPDSENLTYNFEIAMDTGFTQNVASATGIAAGQGATSWTVPVSLQENGWYYWRAQADDWLSTGPWSTTATLFVNTANDPPSAPVIAAPSSGATVAALTTDVVVANSTDPDSEMLSYYFEADTAPSFDSPALIRSGSVAEGESAAAWQLSGLLDNTRYFVRVKASDGAAESPWSATEFFANTANDAPTTPIIANPSDGGAVTTFTPALSVHNATDLDRDPLSYQFELHADAALGNLVAQSNSIAEGSQATAWEVPVPLTENLTYYWRARASDGSLSSSWTPAASFTVNTANDAPGAPAISSPAEEGSVTTLTPTLAVLNAVDPDSGSLAYDFEVYSGGSLVASQQGVPGDGSGTTSWTLGTPILDNTAYQWRARAYDGNSYGPWTAMAAFTVHVGQVSRCM